ncbi:MAG: LysR substrate-binding domain-containing protein [Sphingobium sp.]|uniref:LysR substrate-binding domain-containing protein n=1 Tax=Sphingobium sp. TaxID=1912891 RepID=UPI003BB00AA3
MVQMSELPSLIAIQAFEAAARCGSFAAAARELGTSAASVSYHVKRLERQAGFPLFRRLAQRVELTEAGGIIASEASAAFAALRGSFARASVVEQNSLRISALPTFVASWLVPRLGAFRERRPHISISVDASPDVRDLTAGDYDVAVRNGHGDWPGLCAIPLFPAVFAPLCAPSLTQTARALIASLPGNLPLLGRRDWWLLWLTASGANWRPTPDEFATSFSTEHLDASAGIAGQGITIGSPILFGDDINSGRLMMPHPLVVGDGRWFFAVYPEARRGCPKIEAFVSWISEAAQESLNSADARVADAMIIRPETVHEW